MATGRVSVGFIHPGEVAGAFTLSLAQTVLRDRGERINHVMSVESSPNISEGRSQLVDGFLQDTRDEWLWMVDADMQWEPEAFDVVYEHADVDSAPIVGGLCFAGGRCWDGSKPNIVPAMYRFENVKSVIVPQPMRDYPRDQLVPVGATGAAFLLVHRKVFLHLQKALRRSADGSYNPYPWFAEILYKGNSMGEDMTFCYRAGCLGYPIFVHTGARVGHRKAIIMDEWLYDEVSQ